MTEKPKCSECDRDAKYVLVNYHHEIVGDGMLFCGVHAFEDGRERCPCCTSYTIEVYDERSEEDVELLPTYIPGALDDEGCCSEHP